MNGEQLATALKQLRPDIPIILLTGYAEDSFVAAKPRAIDLVLGKPLSRATLRRALVNLIRR